MLSNVFSNVIVSKTTCGCCITTGLIGPGVPLGLGGPLLLGHLGGPPFPLGGPPPTGGPPPSGVLFHWVVLLHIYLGSSITG